MGSGMKKTSKSLLSIAFPAQSGFEKYPSFYRAYAQIIGHEPSGDRGMDRKQEKLFETL